MSVYGYVRVSSLSGRQRGSIVSVSSQIAAINKYKSNNLPDTKWGIEIGLDGIRGIFGDINRSAWKGKKGYLKNRPQGSRLFSALKPGDHVIFYSVDRGFRNVGDFGMFLNHCVQNDITVHFTHQNLNMATPSGKMQAYMHAVVAEYYSSVLSMRVREALSVRTSKSAKKRDERVIPSFASRLPDAISVTPQETTGTIYLYTRVSDSSQVDSGLGLQAQEEIIAKYAEQLADANPGLTVSREVYSDKGVGAFRTQMSSRKSGKQLLAKVKKGDHVVALRFDRVFRNVVDGIEVVEHLKSKGAVLHLSSDGLRTDTRECDVIMNLMLSLSEMESKMKSIRQIEVFEEMRRQGRMLNQHIPKCHSVKKKGNKKVIHIDYQKVIDSYAYLLLSNEHGRARAQLLMRWVRSSRANDKPHEKYDLYDERRSASKPQEVMNGIAQSWDKVVLDDIRDKGREVAALANTMVGKVRGWAWTRGAKSSHSIPF